MAIPPYYSQLLHLSVLLVYGTPSFGQFISKSAEAEAIQKCEILVAQCDSDFSCRIRKSTLLMRCNPPSLNRNGYLVPATTCSPDCLIEISKFITEQPRGHKLMQFLLDIKLANVCLPTSLNHRVYACYHYLKYPDPESIDLYDESIDEEDVDIIERAIKTVGCGKMAEKCSKLNKCAHHTSHFDQCLHAVVDYNTTSLCSRNCACLVQRIEEELIVNEFWVEFFTTCTCYGVKCVDFSKLRQILLKNCDHRTMQQHNCNIHKVSPAYSMESLTTTGNRGFIIFNTFISSCVCMHEQGSMSNESYNLKSDVANYRKRFPIGKRRYDRTRDYDKVMGRSENVSLLAHWIIISVLYATVFLLLLGTLYYKIRDFYRCYTIRRTLSAHLKQINQSRRSQDLTAERIALSSGGKREKKRMHSICNRYFKNKKRKYHYNSPSLIIKRHSQQRQLSRKRPFYENTRRFSILHTFTGIGMNGHDELNKTI